MAGTHAFLAPSFAPVWGHCSAAPVMAAMYPQEDTQDTREGEAAHWFAEQILKGVPKIDMRAPNGTVVTDDMREAAMMFVRDVQDMRDKYPDAVRQGGSEIKVNANRISEHCYGTTDYALYLPSHNRLINWNFKYGHREVVEYEDLQEICYVAGELDLFKIDGALEQNLTVEIRIVQPRCFTARGPIRSWEVKATDLRGYYNQLTQRAVEAVAPQPVATSGSHCFYCPARHSCEASRRSAYAAMDYSGKALPEPLTPSAVSFELQLLERAAEAIEGRMTGLQEQAKQMIKQGKIVPGFGLIEGKGRLAWKDVPAADIRALGAAYGIQLDKPDVFITPTQAKAKGIDEFVINAYAETPSTGLKLVKQSPKDIARILSTTT